MENVILAGVEPSRSSRVSPKLQCSASIGFFSLNHTIFTSLANARQVCDANTLNALEALRMKPLAACECDRERQWPV